jgi:hypothetical protein
MEHDTHFDFRLSVALLARVDKWRNRLPVPPSRSAAMRYLLERGLDAEATHNDRL